MESRGGARLQPDHLCLEITETALLDSGSSTGARLPSLKDLGVTVALDDFGTRWSSLAHLQRFPIDTIKIDGSFRPAGTSRLTTHDRSRSGPEGGS